MKKLNWVLKDSGGTIITWASCRASVRESKKWYEENIFENPWVLDNYKFPLKIIREEWELVDERAVR